MRGLLRRWLGIEEIETDVNLISRQLAQSLAAKPTKKVSKKK